jgi:hypothetical protein
MPTLLKEIGRPGPAIKRSVEQKGDRGRFSRIGRNGDGKLRPVRNIQQIAAEFPHGEPSRQKRGAPIAPHLVTPLDPMDSATPLDRRIRVRSGVR